MEKISVIIPVRNRKKNLYGAVKSLLKQDFDKNDFEIIVVDYGGSDDSKKMLEEFNDDRIRYIYVDENGIWNLPRARNIGIRRAKGKLIITMDGDMILSKNVLKKVYEDFYKRKKSVLYQIPRREITKNKAINAHPPGPFPGCFQDSDRKNWFKVRGFDERMTGYGYEDGDLVMRMKRIGVEQYWMPSTLKIYHQYHEESFGAETYVNMIKSLLNFSYVANDKN
jgi:glycosyltransferase involved in cell wall biosynthesis